MGFVTEEQIAAAKRMTAIEYLQKYQPQRLVRCKYSKTEYQLADHDSFKINQNTSYWHWKSRDIGGKTALDFLIHVDGLKFVEAVRQLCEKSPCYLPDYRSEEAPKKFKLPPAAANNREIIRYLRGRGISTATLQACIENGLLYESYPYHNCVFVGRDEDGTPHYAALRGIWDRPGRKPFRTEQTGSDKRWCFYLPPSQPSKRLAIYEAAIDALAHRTLEKEDASKWRLSLGGIYAPKEGEPDRGMKRPVALTHFLSRHPEIEELELCFDNDFAGRWAARHVREMYQDKFAVTDNPPPVAGWDYGEMAKEAMKQKSKEATR